MKKILSVLLVLSFFLFGCGDSKTKTTSKKNTSEPHASTLAEQSSINPGAVFKRPANARKAPDFNLPSINGGNLKLSDFKGKVIILDFWATWCPPCKAEIPSFIDLQKTYKNSGLQVIGIALDNLKRVKPFAKNFKMNYPVVIGNQSIASEFGGIRGIPTTFVIDKEGYIIKHYVGYKPKEMFQKDFLTLK